MPFHELQESPLFWFDDTIPHLLYTRKRQGILDSLSGDAQRQPFSQHGWLMMMVVPSSGGLPSSQVIAGSPKNENREQAFKIMVCGDTYKLCTHRRETTDNIIENFSRDIFPIKNQECISPCQ